MIKRVFCLILVFLLLTTLVFAGARKAVKIEDRIYAGDLTNAPEGVVIMGESGIDNTDTIEFLVNDIGYNLKVESNLPESVSFTLIGSEQAITVRIHQESSFVLADGSTVFVRYLEYERLASDIKLYIGNVGSAVQSEEVSEEETTEEEEETISQEEETSANLSEETEDEITNKQWDLKINKKYLLIGGAAVVLVLIILGFIVLFKRRKRNKITKKESNSEKKENPSTSSKSSEKKDEESFFDPVKD